MQHLGLICTILLIVGGLNWGLIGALDMNLVEMIFGTMPMLVKVVYILVGLAAVYELVQMIKARG